MHKAVRSKAFHIENIKDISRIAEYDWSEIIPDDLNDNFYSFIVNQLTFLKNAHILYVTKLCKELKIATKTYYYILKKIKDPEYKNIVDNQEEEEEEEENEELEVGRHPLFDDKEESFWLNQILDRQMKGDCMPPRESKDCLQKNATTQGKDVTIDRQWWYIFKIKYKEILGVMKIHSLENKRTKLQRNKLMIILTNWSLRFLNQVFHQL